MVPQTYLLKLANNRIEIAFLLLSLGGVGRGGVKVEIKANSAQPTVLKLDWAGQSLAINESVLNGLKHEEKHNKMKLFWLSPLIIWPPYPFLPIMIHATSGTKKKIKTNENWVCMANGVQARKCLPTSLV